MRGESTSRAARLLERNSSTKPPKLALIPSKIIPTAGLAASAIRGGGTRSQTQWSQRCRASSHTTQTKTDSTKHRISNPKSLSPEGRIFLCGQDPMATCDAVSIAVHCLRARDRLARRRTKRQTCAAEESQGAIITEKRLLYRAYYAGQQPEHNGRHLRISTRILV